MHLRGSERGSHRCGLCLPRRPHIRRERPDERQEGADLHSAQILRRGSSCRLVRNRLGLENGSPYGPGLRPLRNGSPASPATAFASSVLPVPGAPTMRTPFGTFPPSLRKRSGSRRNRTTSISSSFASSMPATSAKRTFVFDSTNTFARLCPIPIMELTPVPVPMPCQASGSRRRQSGWLAAARMLPSRYHSKEDCFSPILISVDDLLSLLAGNT